MRTALQLLLPVSGPQLEPATMREDIRTLQMVPICNREAPLKQMGPNIDTCGLWDHFRRTAACVHLHGRLTYYSLLGRNSGTQEPGS